MTKKFFLFYCLVTISAAFAEPLSDAKLKLSGRALANYQTCSLVAKEIPDKVMESYYLEMFNDSSANIKSYPKKSYETVISEFNRSVDKFKKIDKQIMTMFCLKRFSPLSRKMQEKKLLDK